MHAKTDENELDIIRLNMKRSTTGDFISDNTFFDTILIAAGKTPNIQKLYLNGAGIEYSLEEGIYVDEYMRTSNFNVFAIG